MIFMYLQKKPASIKSGFFYETKFPTFGFSKIKETNNFFMLYYQ
jgi:hypothetical protein